MRVACWIITATNTHSGYVVLTAFPLQQWLYERASVLGYTYIACLVCISMRKLHLDILVGTGYTMLPAMLRIGKFVCLMDRLFFYILRNLYFDLLLILCTSKQCLRYQQ